MSQQSELLNHIVKLTSETLEVNPSDITTGVNIQELGFASITLVSFVEKISADLGEDIHPGVFFEHSTLDAFCNFLLETKPEAVAKLVDKTSMDAEEKTAADGADPWASFEPSTKSDKATEKMEQPKSMQNGALPQDVPVIIGGGIGGMLISRQLSRSKIPHVLIGSHQLSDSPKLGESMTEACTIEFTQDFKDYSQYFFPKDCTPFFMGDIVAGLRFDFFGTFASLFLDNDVPQTFIHVDRIGFDKALYEEVSQYEECHWIDDLVVDIEYEKDTDSISMLHLKNGQTIKPSYAWDCTNHIRLIGRKLDIPYTNFDDQRQVTFTHYYNKEGQDLCHREDLPWMHATTLLRADENIDNLKGVSWFIPLGSYISVGISMEPGDIGNRNPEEIITALTKAYQVRGIDYTKDFSRRKEVISIPSQHFMYDRFYGGNWAMVGGSAASTWFTSGSNISMLACMAAMSDKIIHEPKLYGEHYSRHVRGFAQTQKVYDNLLLSDLGPLDATKFLSSIIEQARRRISSYYMFRKGIDNDISSTAKELWEEDVVIDKQYFDFLRQVATHALPDDREHQTAAIFEKLSGLKENTEKIKIPYLRESNSRRKRAELFN